MSIKTLEEIKASVTIEQYVNGHWEVSELLFKNKGLGNLSVDQMKGLSPTGLDILAVTLMDVAHQALLTRQSRQNDNIRVGVDLAVEAAGAVEQFKTELSSIATQTLLTLEFAVSNLPRMPHQILGSDRMDQKSLDADLMRWLVQSELDTRNAGTLEYSWGEMYTAMAIPEEFLKYFHWGS